MSLGILRVLVVDDEELARRRLTRLLGSVPEVLVVGECEDADAMVKRVGEGDVDLVLLDVHMPGLTGMDALSVLPRGGAAPEVVFCTAHADFAVRAFDEGAVDYVLKPVELPRLVKAIDRARARVVERRSRVASPSGEDAREDARGALQRLAVSTKAGIVLVDPRDVVHAVLDGVLVTVVTTEAEYVSDFTLQDLEKKLPADRFVRVHRRALVNLEHVTRLEPTSTGGFVARTSRGHGVEVSRQAARDLRVRLGLRRPSREGDEDD